MTNYFLPVKKKVIKVKRWLPFPSTPSPLFDFCLFEFLSFPKVISKHSEPPPKFPTHPHSLSKATSGSLFCKLNFMKPIVSLSVFLVAATQCFFWQQSQRQGDYTATGTHRKRQERINGQCRSPTT